MQLRFPPVGWSGPPASSSVSSPIAEKALAPEERLLPTVKLPRHRRSVAAPGEATGTLQRAATWWHEHVEIVLWYAHAPAVILYRLLSTERARPHGMGSWCLQNTQDMLLKLWTTMRKRLSGQGLAE
jgi:hypothetical protein